MPVLVGEGILLFGSLVQDVQLRHAELRVRAVKSEHEVMRS
jgi:hypothetical protein